MTHPLETPSTVRARSAALADAAREYYTARTGGARHRAFRRMQALSSFTLWQETELTALGRYRGAVLLGFYYSYGEYIPVDKRYSAWLEWSWAHRADTAYTKLTQGSP